MKIVTASQMAELDRQTTTIDGISEKTLIARAGKTTAEWIAARFTAATRRILVLAGKGHNGADGAVAARWLRRLGYSVKVINAWEKKTIQIVESEINRHRRSKFQLLIVDAIFGTGLNRPLAEPFRSLVRLLNSSRLEIIALDIPSGLHADSGLPLGVSIEARHTLAFGLPKLGLVQEYSADYVGDLHILDIGFPQNLVARIQTPYDLLTVQDIAPLCEPRKRTAHKGDSGRPLIIGGSVGLAGAPALSARAALRTGAGLVSLIVPQAIYNITARLAGPEVMVHPIGRKGTKCFNQASFSKLHSLLINSTALVLGPGLGQNPSTRSLVQTLIRSSPVPMVLDADALNLISGSPSILRQARQKIIITPHPGEMGRLMGISPRKVQADRFRIAETFAKKWKVTVVLKGARSIIAHQEHTHGIRFSVNALAGNPGMATGGSGDVLAGILGALLARDLSAADSARGGVFLHALAGDLAMPETGGGIAGDLIEKLPGALLSIAS